MAKKKAAEGENKSAAIRAFKEANPEAKPKAIVEGLAAQSIEVTPQMVSTVLSNAKKKGGVVGKRGPKAGKKLGRGAESLPADFITALDAVIAGSEFLKKAGSVERAKEIIDRLGHETHG